MSATATAKPKPAPKTKRKTKVRPHVLKVEGATWKETMRILLVLYFGAPQKWMSRRQGSDGLWVDVTSPLSLARKACANPKRVRKAVEWLERNRYVERFHRRTDHRWFIRLREPTPAALSVAELKLDGPAEEAL